MERTTSFARALLRGAALSLAVLALLTVARVHAAITGKLQGRIVATDNGEPIGFADLQLIPADTTMKRVGGLTNADGTFLLEAAPGRYSLQVRALSYARKRIEGLVLAAGRLTPFSTGLSPEALAVEEIVVEAKARQNTEQSMLQARKRAASVGDAVSAEQVRRSPDKDAAEVLRRVTGLSVSDGKYVFVRGMGERYSSTEIDGVRIATPEQNKRVVPLDLLPANLLENIVVQKTYTADRPGEFGGGDVQVRTRDFPGQRTWSASFAQGWNAGVTGRDHLTYSVIGRDLWGFGVGSRELPGIVGEIAGSRPLVLSTNPQFGFTKSTLATVARAFSNVWSPMLETASPNLSASLSYGDEFKLLGKPLGLVEAVTYSRTLDSQRETQRFYMDRADTLYDYDVRRDDTALSLSSITALAYRPSPQTTYHLRGLWTHSADDEVRIYEGQNHNQTDAFTGQFLTTRGTRLNDVERDILSGSLEGRHDLRHVLNSTFEWRFSRSRASRLQPDRRETNYNLYYYPDANGDLVGTWTLASSGNREFGDLRDEGWGTVASWSVPFRLASLGNGKLIVGYDRQTKSRRSSYRRFGMVPSDTADVTRSPDSLFSPTQFTGKRYTGWIEENTLDVDNYRASSRIEAGYLSSDVPFGRRVRGTFGVRFEHGVQDVRSFDLFRPARITAHGFLDNLDWLPSANLTVEPISAVNVRLGASRTISRPDLNELSPSPALEYLGGLQVAGNPALHRATIDNYDARVEAFPSLGEVVAAGVFLKRMHEPIEQVIQGGAPPILVPRNSDSAVNRGMELEMRLGLGRIARMLDRFAVNANASFIHSEVTLKKQLSKLGSERHPLAGQADVLSNVALSARLLGGRADATVLVGHVGKRLRTLGLFPSPDVYQQPVTTLDATLNWNPSTRLRVKLAGKNLLDPRIQDLQLGKEVSGFRRGRTVTLVFTYGG